MLSSPYFWIPFEVFINLYIGGLSVWYIYHLLTKKRPEKVSLYICSLLIGTAYSSFLLADHLSLKLYFSDFWVYGIIVLYTFLFFKDHWSRKLLWLTVLFTLINTSVSVSYCLFSSIFRCTYTDLLVWGRTRLLFMLFANSLDLILLFIVVRLYSPIRKAYYLRQSSIIMLSLINLAVLLIEEFLFNLYPEGDMSSRWFFFICTLCLSVCILSLFLYRILFDYSENTARLQYQDQQREIINERLSEANEMFDSVNRLQHDMMKHIDVAADLFRNGEDEKALKYLESFKEKLPPMFSTGCLSLDSALTIRARLMEENTISFLPELCNLSKLPMKDVDFCTIIMNLLDNSIEELNRSREEIAERYVRLQIRRVREMLMIRCENPCSSIPLQKTKGGFISRKRSSGVGMGIPVINQIVKEAKGVVQMVQQDGHFIVTISIPINEEDLIDAAPNPYADLY